VRAEHQAVAGAAGPEVHGLQQRVGGVPGVHRRGRGRCVPGRAGHCGVGRCGDRSCCARRCCARRCCDRSCCARRCRARRCRAHRRLEPSSTGTDTGAALE
jgi:hypothetical protein